MRISLFYYIIISTVGLKGTGSVTIILFAIFLTEYHDDF